MTTAPVDDARDTSTRWHRAADLAGVHVAAEHALLAAAADAIAARGRFVVVLAGGDTPRGLYERLPAVATDWSAWEVWFGDERCLPPDDPSRNSAMARAAWLDHVAIPRAQVHAIPAELGPVEAASAYAASLAAAGRFDVVLLGLGEDGHTASIFPGQRAGTAADDPSAVAVFDAPKPPPERVSLSAARLSDTRAAFALVSGTGKRDAVARWRRGEPIPAATVRPPSGIDVFLDAAALGE